MGETKNRLSKLAEVGQRIATLKDRWLQSKVADQQRKEDLRDLVETISSSTLGQYSDKEKPAIVITAKDGDKKLYFYQDAVNLESLSGNFSTPASYKEIDEIVRTLRPTHILQLLEYALENPEAIELEEWNS